MIHIFTSSLAPQLNNRSQLWLEKSKHQRRCSFLYTMLTVLQDCTRKNHHSGATAQGCHSKAQHRPIYITLKRPRSYSNLSCKQGSGVEGSGSCVTYPWLKYRSGRLTMGQQKKLRVPQKPVCLCEFMQNCRGDLDSGIGQKYAHCQ